MACQLLQITGVRYVNDNYFVTNEDIKKQERKVLDLAKDASLYLTCQERKNLYKSSIKNPAVVLARCILKSSGHPLTRSNYRFPQHGVPVREWKTVSKYLLDTNLLVQGGIVV
tara:strand:- start:302 stop:640 length:339 start_codon:yes stop_codon:yes gene_type:complete